MIGTWRGRALLGPDLRRDLVAVELGQHDVEQDQVGRLGAPEPEAFRAVDGDDDLVALLLQRVLEQALDVWVVVDDEDLGRHQSPSWLPPFGALSGTGGVDYRRAAPRARRSARRRNASTRSSYAAGAVAWPGAVTGTWDDHVLGVRAGGRGQALAAASGIVVSAAPWMSSNGTGSIRPITRMGSVARMSPPTRRLAASKIWAARKPRNGTAHAVRDRQRQLRRD